MPAPSSPAVVLGVLYPFRRYPRFETWVAGAPIDQLNWASVPLLKKLLLSFSYGHYNRANPRPADYMKALAREVAQKHFPNSTLEMVEYNGALPKHSYGQILLLYPDAIGFGWGKIEREALKLNIPVTVANGRRRVFAFQDYRGALRWRRFLERTWLIEYGMLLLSALCFPIFFLMDVAHALKKRLIPAKPLHG